MTIKQFENNFTFYSYVLGKYIEIYGNLDLLQKENQLKLYEFSKQFNLEKTGKTIKGSKKLGRPTDYTQEIADKFCEEISQGKSLRKICLSDDMPSGVTIFSWLRLFPEFLKQYEKATDERTEMQQEMIIDIGDEAIKHAESTDAKASNAVVAAYRLKSDNLKWSMSKMKPKKYGDKIDMTTGGKELPTPIMFINRDAISTDNSNTESIEINEEN